MPSLPTLKPGRPVGVVGLGIMARGMVANLKKAGFVVHGFSRTREKCADLIADGLIWHDSPGELAAAVDAVITMVGYPTDVEEVYFGDQGILGAARPGTLLIDMTTSAPSLAERLAEAAAAKGCAALDAPVSGGDVGARNGTLAIMVGGAEDAFEAARPLFEAMGQTIARLGPAGAGQHTKMVNQTVIAGTILGVAEALAYADKAGLDQSAVLDVIGQGAAGGFQLNVLGKRMVEGDFAPGFFVHHFLKDLGIAQQEAGQRGLDLKALKLAIAQFTRHAQAGGREDGTQGIYQSYLR
ncbi:NAD(P)-dependent oxidoreductase [Roseospirillum parvum]|uniref:3-hydroxyisobutyrate dehydrogenase n=1 Tax=Roseospirillum parvum TaxID=83401 RepID=A0A1G7YN99_9PROT|nr:NAD(P)-dependent oxidoreductase [Roseospirillum parvum]SDG97796.1 3-hydroxyisobutyrate dehydrogenase [Roseospirillum parvum]